jgi:hypothetical protein
VAEKMESLDAGSQVRSSWAKKHEEEQAKEGKDIEKRGSESRG